MKTADVSAATGMGITNLATLKASPAFEELIAHYQAQEDERQLEVDELRVDVQKRLVTLGLSISEELMERLINAPEGISTKDLNELLKSTLDRGGHSPVHKSESISAVLSVEELTQIKAAVTEAQKGGSNAAKAKEVPAGSGTTMGATRADGATELEAAPTTGLESEGPGVRTGVRETLPDSGPERGSTPG